MKHRAILLALLFSSVAHAQVSLKDQIRSVAAEQERLKIEEQEARRFRQIQQEETDRLVRAQEKARRDQQLALEKERQKQAYELEKLRIEQNASKEKELLELRKQEAAKAEKQRLRAQAYEDEMLRLDLQERKAEVATRRARADRANDYIDRELSREDASTDVIRSHADASRNLSQGGKELMKGLGKGAENEGKNWFK